MVGLDLATVVDQHVDTFLPIVLDRLPFQVDDGFVPDLRRFVKEAISALMSRTELDSLKMTDENIRLICVTVGRKCIATAVAMAGDANAFAAMGAGLGSSVEVVISASMRHSGVVPAVPISLQVPVVQVVEAESVIDVAEAPVIETFAPKAPEGKKVIAAPIERYRAPVSVLAPRPQVDNKPSAKPGSLAHFVENIANFTFEFISNLIERAFYEKNNEAIIAFGEYILFGVPTSKNWTELIDANVKVAKLLLKNARFSSALSHAKRALEIQSLFGPNSRVFMEERRNFVGSIEGKIERRNAKDEAGVKDEKGQGQDDAAAGGISLGEASGDDFERVIGAVDSALRAWTLDQVQAVSPRLLGLDCVNKKVYGKLITLNIHVSGFFERHGLFAEALDHRRAILNLQQQLNPNDVRIQLTLRIISQLEERFRESQSMKGVGADETDDDLKSKKGGAKDVGLKLEQGSVDVASGLDNVAEAWLDANFPEEGSWQRLTMEYLLRHEEKLIARKNIWDSTIAIQSQFPTLGAYLGRVSGFLTSHADIAPFKIESSNKGTMIVRN